MKHLKPRLHTQRRLLEQKLKIFTPLMKVPPPPSGWVQAIRESLGMTARQLGAYLGMGAVAATKLEQREKLRSITLRDLDRAAAILNCRVVYALVPNDGLEATLRARAEALAERISTKVSHSMKLEEQSVAQSESRAQVEALTKRLIESLDSQLWELTEKKGKKK